MVGIVLITVVGIGAIAFMVRFFIALCQDGPSGTCHIVHVLRNSEMGRSPAPPVSATQALAFAAPPQSWRSQISHHHQDAPAATSVQERRA